MVVVTKGGAIDDVVVLATFSALDDRSAELAGEDVVVLTICGSMTFGITVPPGD